jgi:uncharacterized protein YjbI with pentapeptide repeats
VVVAVGVALIVAGVIGGTVTAWAQVYATVRVVALAAFHHWPVALIAVGALVVGGTMFRRELDPRTNQRTRTGLLVLVGLGVVLGLLALLLGPITAWVAGPHVEQLHGKDLAGAVNAVRQTLLATAAGLAAVVGLGFTGRTFYLSRRGQVTDRYAKAVALLASEKMAERAGAVYALEHVMRESAVDHDTVVNLLAAFVRERAPAAAVQPAAVGPVGAGAPKQEELELPPTDVQTALTVLARRPDRTERQPLDLSRSHLARTELAAARLASANLTRTDLTGADLTRTDLTGADLTGARLIGANLTGADVTGAKLIGANMTVADLFGANLTRAKLFGANLTRAKLLGANLTRAKLLGADLTHANLTRARLIGARLIGADLTHANLIGVDLTHVDLTHADLTHANLIGADLTGADLDATQLAVAVLDGSTTLDGPLRVALSQIPRSGPEPSSHNPEVGPDPPQPAS